MTRSTKGLSYVLGDSYSTENHILPINAIQHCPDSHKVYTAGRDGAIKVWSPQTFEPHSQLAASGPTATNEDLDEQLLKLETSICSSSLPHPPVPAHNYHVARSYNIHFDWVNDLSLVNSNTSLVTCLSDLSLKYIDLPASADDVEGVVHKFENVHTDYIKKVSSMPHESKIVSGGLDGNVVVWDLTTLRAVLRIQNTSSRAAVGQTETTGDSKPPLVNSIYSLANDHGLVSCGGPNNTINIFDIRASTPFVKKLIGHQDNIRCLLMNDKFILSGSSDTTIKLWDTRNYKVLQTFEMHDDPIWTLATSNNLHLLESFYSGDKAGNIIMTDISYTSKNRRGDEYYPNGYNSSIDDTLGVLTILSSSTSNASVLSLCVESTGSTDCTVFASSSLSLERFHVPTTSKLARYQYLRTCLEVENNLTNQDLIMGTNEDVNDLNSGFYDLVSHLSIDSNNYDLQSSLTVPNTLAFNDVSADTNVYDSMFLNVNGGPSEIFVNNISSVSERSNVSGATSEAPVEILLNPLPQDQIIRAAYNCYPIQRTSITPKSVIAKRLFNNKRHMIVLYLNGDIGIWDIFVCKEIKVFLAPEGNPIVNNDAESFAGSVNTVGRARKFLELRTKDMDGIFQQSQTSDTLNNWCDVEIKAGKLLVTLKESTFDNTKIYYDDLCRNYPFLALGHPDSVEANNNPRVKATDDERFYISRIFLNSIFHQYAIYEWDFDLQLRTEMRNLRPSSAPRLRFALRGNSTNTTDDETSHSNEDVNGGTSKRISFFKRKSLKSAMPQVGTQHIHQPQASPQMSAQNSISESTFSLADGSTAVADFLEFNHENMTEQDTSSPDYHDSIMKLLQINKQRYKEKGSALNKKKIVDSLLSIYSNDPRYESKSRPSTAIDETKLIFDIYKPLISPHRLPANLLIIILEHSPELGNLRDLYSFHLEDINRLKIGDESTNTRELVNNLRMFLPKWIGQPILYDFFPAREGPKIAFQLVEYDFSQVSGDETIGGKPLKKAKKLPISESNIKLSSHNMLRVSKILSYLTDKFDSRTAEMKDHKKASEWLVLECRNQVLPHDMTLQTIKTRIWKSSSEIVLVYRRMFDDESLHDT